MTKMVLNIFLPAVTHPIGHMKRTPVQANEINLENNEAPCAPKLSQVLHAVICQV